MLAFPDLLQPVRLVQSGNIALLQNPSQAANSGWNFLQLGYRSVCDGRLYERHCKLSPCESHLRSCTCWRLAKLYCTFAIEKAVEIPRVVAVILMLHQCYHRCAFSCCIYSSHRLLSSFSRPPQVLAIEPVAFGISVRPSLWRHQCLQSRLKMNGRHSNSPNFFESVDSWWLVRNVDMRSMLLTCRNAIVALKIPPRCLDMISPC